MSSSGKSHSISNPFRAQGSSDCSSLKDWTHESASDEVSLVEKEGLVEEEEAMEEEENFAGEGEEEDLVPKKKSRAKTSCSLA